jgi:hypothetical protein
MHVAFKEWAVVVDALTRGEQIFILRKGGIHEGRGGFRMEHSEFLLFPTQFHQQREAVIPSAQEQFDKLSPSFDANTIRFDSLARVIEWHQLDNFEGVQRLAGQHIWRDEVIAERFDWGKKGIYAIAVRVFGLAAAVEIPNLPEYGGCKSWISLQQEVSTAGARPVLSDAEFSARLANFRAAARSPGLLAADR